MSDCIGNQSYITLATVNPLPFLSAESESIPKEQAHS